MRKQLSHPDFDETRAFLNDPGAIIATDEALHHFVLYARAQVPVIAAALFALSKGANDTHDRLMAHVGAMPKKEAVDESNLSPGGK